MLFRVLILALSGSALVLSSPLLKETTTSKVTNSSNKLPDGPVDASNACQKLDELRGKIRDVTASIKELQIKTINEPNEFVVLENAAKLVSKYDELSMKNKALSKEIENAQKQGCKKAQQLINPEKMKKLGKIKAIRKVIIENLKKYMKPAVTNNDVKAKTTRKIQYKRSTLDFQKVLNDHHNNLHNLMNDLNEKKTQNIKST